MYFYLSKILAPLINIANFVFFSIILLMILNFFYKKNIIKKILIFFSIIFFIITFLPLGNFLINSIEKKYSNKKNLPEYQNIVVLAGHTDRLIASVKLALEKKNSKIIFLGGSGYMHKTKKNESDIARIFYQNIGFDLNRVIFVSTARNTIEALREFEKLNINKNNDILITSAFHMDRSLYISKHLNLTFTPYAVDFIGTKGNEKLINLYQNFDISKNLRKVNVFFREKLGIIVSKIIL